MKNQFKIKNPPCLQEKSDAVCKSYVGNTSNDSSIIKNAAHIDQNYKYFTYARFIQVHQLPQNDSHSTAKLYVDNAIDEISFVRKNRDNNFNKNNSTNINSITLNTQAVNDDQNFTKACVDQFHQKNQQSRQDLVMDFYDELSDLVQKQ